jgi:hypothetical protein
MAAVNITEYWDVVMAHPNATGVNAGLGMKTAAEYIGFFMDTNDNGDSTRANGTSQPPALGTYTVDQEPGFREFVRWDPVHLFRTPPPSLPPNKNGYYWGFTYLDCLMVSDDSLGFDFCAAQIDSGLPVKIDFLYWNPIPTGASVVDSASGETIDFMEWGDAVSSSEHPDHQEEWNEQPGGEGIGHAVTGVGYYRNIDPDDDGPLPSGDYIIVHDNWVDTPVNVAVHWENWNASIGVDPRFGRTIANPVDLQPHFDWGAISSFAGLSSAGAMGIYLPTHGRSFYFPADSLAPFTGYPKTWLIPGLHVATYYGPGNVRVSTGCPVPNSIVTVPDANGKACSLFVSIPQWSDINETSDLNVIQLSQGEVVGVAVDDTVETVVFLACADGWVEYPGGPSGDEQLEVHLDYNGGPIDTVSFSDIHPVGRLDIVDPLYPPSWIFVYENEVLVCDPAYFESPPLFDSSHSEAWHWYTLYPDKTKLLDSVEFEGKQAADSTEIYILALSYSKPLIPATGISPFAGTQPGSESFYYLSPSRPNPFSLATDIRYYLPVESRVRLEVFDVLGRRIATLVDGSQGAGHQTVRWETGTLSSGVYFCRLEAGGHVEAKRMVLIK